jgi:large subunit ribosomal protein L23
MVQTTHSIKLQPYQVVLHPLVTEKGTHISERHNAYTFSVSPFATKSDIKHAVEELWSVRVLHVRTQTRKGKPRRHLFKLGHTIAWKKAIVKLHHDDRIAFF